MVWGDIRVQNVMTLFTVTVSYFLRLSCNQNMPPTVCSIICVCVRIFLWKDKSIFLALVALTDTLLGPLETKRHRRLSDLHRSHKHTHI